MRSIIYFLTSAFVVALLSCEPPVVFSEPQPHGLTPDRYFSLFYRGAFFCESDSAIVHITNNTIYKEKAFPFAITLEEIRKTPGVQLLGDQLIIDSLHQSFDTEIIGDSVFAELILKDTLFSIGRDQVLTSFRGHQILNRRIDNERWEVVIISLDNNMDLELAITTVPEDLERLRSITPVEDISRGDTLQFLLSPTLYEFSQILEQQLIFETCDHYRRIAVPVEI